MKLFIIREMLRDYSSGMIAVKAQDLTEARNYFREWMGNGFDDYYVTKHMEEFDLAVGVGAYHTLELADTDENEVGIVTVVWGGG